MPHAANAPADLAEARWKGCFEAFRNHLDEQWEALRAGRAEEIRAFPVPPAMPPVPASLTAAATVLIGHAEELERGLLLAQEEVRRQMSLARRMDTSSSPPASFIEQRV